MLFDFPKILGGKLIPTQRYWAVEPPGRCVERCVLRNWLMPLLPLCILSFEDKARMLSAGAGAMILDFTASKTYRDILFFMNYPELLGQTAEKAMDAAVPNTWKYGSGLGSQWVEPGILLWILGEEKACITVIVTCGLVRERLGEEKSCWNSWIHLRN